MPYYILKTSECLKWLVQEKHSENLISKEKLRVWCYKVPQKEWTPVPLFHGGVSVAMLLIVKSDNFKLAERHHIFSGLTDKVQIGMFVGKPG